MKQNIKSVFTDEKIYSSHEEAARKLISELPPIIDRFLENFSNLDTELKETDYDVNQFQDWSHYYKLNISQLLEKTATSTGDIDNLIQISNSLNKVDSHLSLFSFVGPHKPPSQFNVNRDFGLSYALHKSFVSIFYFQRTMKKLVTQIENGFDNNDNLIQKVLRVDKTAINLPCIQKRFKEAQLRSDQKFFDKIGNVMKNRSPTKIHADAKLTFAVFWLLDLKLYNLFSEYGRYLLLKRFNKTGISQDSFESKINNIKKLY